MKRKPIFVVLLTVFVDLLGFGIVIPLLPFYAEHFGATPTVIGLLSSSYSLMQFLFIPFWGRLSDRLGRRPIILISVFGSFVSYLVFGFANSLFLLFLSRILGGFMGANISTAYAYIADSTSSEQRAKYMGLIGAAFGVGFMFGPFIGGIASKISYGTPGLIAAGLSLINAVLAYFILPESLKEKVKHAGKVSLLNVPAIRDAFRKPVVGTLVMASFFYTVAFSNLYVAFPLFTGEVFNYGAAANGYLFAYIGLIGVFIQGGAIGRLVKKFGERGLIISGIVLLLGGLTFLPSAHSLTVLIILVTMLAVGSALVTPPLTSLISKHAGTAEYGSVLGVSRSFSSLARVVGPFWGGFILGTVGISWPFYTGAIMLLFSLTLAWRVPRLQREMTGDPATSK